MDPMVKHELRQRQTREWKLSERLGMTGAISSGWLEKWFSYQLSTEKGAPVLFRAYIGDEKTTAAIYVGIRIKTSSGLLQIYPAGGASRATTTATRASSPLQCLQGHVAHLLATKLLDLLQRAEVPSSASLVSLAGMSATDLLVECERHPAAEKQAVFHGK